MPLTDDDVLVGARAARWRHAPRVANTPGKTVAADAILPLAASGRNEPYVIELDSAEWRALLVADPLNRVAVSAASPR